MKFTNKETYLAYRSEWKAKYKTLSNKIRALKRAIREPGHQITWTEYNQLLQLKTTASQLLNDRKLSKIMAQEYYLAAKLVIA